MTSRDPEELSSVLHPDDLLAQPLTITNFAFLKKYSGRKERTAFGPPCPRCMRWPLTGPVVDLLARVPIAYFSSSMELLQALLGLVLLLDERLVRLHLELQPLPHLRVRDL